MKRLFTKSLLGAGVVAMLAIAGTAHAQTTWRYSSFVPESHFMNKGAFLPWAADVAKVTNGSVKVELLPKIVGTAPSQVDVIRDNLADVAIFVPGYTPGRYDLAGIGELPMLSENPNVAAVAFQRLYDKYLASAGLFREVHVLSAFTVSAGHIFTRTTPIRQVSDLQGMKIRAAVPSTVPSLTALGAVPVQKPVTELFELLSTGAIDGSVSGLDQIVAFKLAEVTKHVTIIPGGMFNSVLVFAVNKDMWNKLSDANKKAISEISGEALAKRVGATFDAPIKEGVEIMKARGNTVATASPELVAAMAERLKPVREAAMEMARKNGVADPKAMMDWYLAEIARLSKS